MYSVVLATMMTLTPSAPETFWFHGCYGCCGCYGCYGCSGCYGYWPGWGCYGCYGCCGGCWGYTCHGCYGSCCGFGYVYYGYYPSCYGCCGGVVVAPPPPKPAEPPPPPKPMLPKPKEDKGEVTITAPVNARVTVDGQPLALQGTTRTFETPILERGHTYSYVFRAEALRDGKAVTSVQKVTLRAGEAKRVDFFSDLSMKAVAHVTIMTPPDAKLIVDGMTYPNGLSKRTLETPALELGRHYSYTMRAEVVRDGRVLRQEQHVDVEAGKDVTVEFKDLPVLQSAQR